MRTLSIATIGIISSIIVLFAAFGSISSETKCPNTTCYKSVSITFGDYAYRYSQDANDSGWYTPVYFTGHGNGDG